MLVTALLVSSLVLAAFGASNNTTDSPQVSLVPKKYVLRKIAPGQGLLAFRPKRQHLFVQRRRGGNKVKNKQRALVLRLKNKIYDLQLQIQNLARKITMMPFADSKILAGKTSYIKQLSQWAPFSHSWTLCYRATRDGWSSTNFHSRCDYKGPTVTIIQVASYIFGGYSDVSWGGSSGPRESWNSFIFSLKNKDGIPPFKSNVYQHSHYAIYSGSSFGPIFGAGNDFHIMDNAGYSKGSYTNFGYTYRPPYGYSYASNNTRSLLAGSYNNFIPSELEVFYLN